MAFSLSFSEEFFWGEGYGPDEPPDPSERPTSLAQALISMPREDFVQLCESEGLEPDAESTIGALVERAKAYDTCNTLTPPVGVYINADWLVEVYE